MELTPQNVQKVFFACLFNDDEIIPGKTPDNAVLVEGITHKIGFHRERLESHKKEIKEFLSKLPESFFVDRGDGMSFLGLPYLPNGNLWGDHQSAQELMLMGIGSKLMKYCAPKEMWSSLPGGVPYVVINLNGFDENKEDPEERPSSDLEDTVVGGPVYKDYGNGGRWEGHKKG